MAKETAEATKMKVPASREGDMSVLVLALKRNIEQAKPAMNVQTSFLIEIGAGDLVAAHQRQQYDSMTDEHKITHTSTVETRRLAELVLS